MSAIAAGGAGAEVAGFEDEDRGGGDGVCGDELVGGGGGGEAGSDYEDGGADGQGGGGAVLGGEFREWVSGVPLWKGLVRRSRGGIY